MEPERPLDPTERRIVGVLIEKELTTPDQYPLSLNALVNGCNQKNNRDPVTAYREFEVEGALRSLFVKHWTTTVSGLGRVPKHRHRVSELLGLSRSETAVLGELLLRGSQQPGELRARAARMSDSLKGLPELQGALDVLAERQLVRRLPRVSGERADRFEHTLAPDDEATPPPAADPAPKSHPPIQQQATEPSGWEVRIEALEARVDALERQISQFRPPADS